MTRIDGIAIKHVHGIMASTVAEMHEHRGTLLEYLIKIQIEVDSYLDGILTAEEAINKVCLIVKE